MAPRSILFCGPVIKGVVLELKTVMLSCLDISLIWVSWYELDLRLGFYSVFPVKVKNHQSDWKLSREDYYHSLLCCFFQQRRQNCDLGQTDFLMTLITARTPGDCFPEFSGHETWKNSHFSISVKDDTGALMQGLRNIKANVIRKKENVWNVIFCRDRSSCDGERKHRDRGLRELPHHAACRVLIIIRK